MVVINRSALVRYEPARMYAIVDDVPRYPEFMPWCRATAVHLDEGPIQEASLTIAKGPFHDTFRTRNTRIPGARIDLALMEGPFRELQGSWTFEAMGEGSKVTLELRFDFANALIGRTLGPVFEGIADGLVDAFVKRARALYG